MQNKGKLPSAPTAEISVVQSAAACYNKDKLVPTCGTDTTNKRGHHHRYEQTQTGKMRSGAFDHADGGAAVRLRLEAASDSTLPTTRSATPIRLMFMFIWIITATLPVWTWILRRRHSRRMGYRAEFTTIDWGTKTELVDNGEIDCIWGCFSMDGRERLSVGGTASGEPSGHRRRRRAASSK